MTHEEFLATIRDTVAGPLDSALGDALRAVKLVYGVGKLGTRGTTVFDAWVNGHPGAVDVVEIAAIAEESPLQLAGTVVHELAHVLAGHPAGHGPGWKDMARFLGLSRPQAAGQSYQDSDLDTHILAVVTTARLDDGKPKFVGAVTSGVRMSTPPGPRPCTAGIGTRGGTSRGPGSGRLRKWVCGCRTPVARVAADDWDVTCNRCRQVFVRIP